ncbi:glycosyltransferase family 4 protein [Sphingomonas paeninsulae]|uniref:glycosyltransferase family 4 protein n=1 Tax=Sphingomonas paeninsulae TaxID=2319844 RepID=UPI001EF04246|nr:glycosyltransferase family 4 protein [Sphingomonas paeninsulae]
MTDRVQEYDYPASVALSIADEDPLAYDAAARFLNAGPFDVVSLQHEFGIFGGPDGSHILRLVEHLRAPLVTTLHTILAAPSIMQRNVIDRIGRASSRVVVMAAKGARLLAGNYNVDPRKIDVIPHGIPDVKIVPSERMKERLGFAGRTVILTFGLLSPNKGIEVMIDAMPMILRSCPDALYIVLGATHPNLLRDNGEPYRDSLAARAKALGVADSILFINQFVERAELLDFIAMCDVYVTPYLSEMQLTSGTLAYSFGLGRPIVSTPYWHAAELLADGRGVLVPFGDYEATGRAVSGLLADPNRRNVISRRSYQEGRAMTWQRTAELYLDLFFDAVGRKVRATESRADLRLSAA